MLLKSLLTRRRLRLKDRRVYYQKMALLFSNLRREKTKVSNRALVNNCRLPIFLFRIVNHLDMFAKTVLRASTFSKTRKKERALGENKTQIRQSANSAYPQCGYLITKRIQNLNLNSENVSIFSKLTSIIMCL